MHTCNENSKKREEKDIEKNFYKIRGKNCQYLMKNIILQIQSFQLNSSRLTTKRSTDTHTLQSKSMRKSSKQQVKNNSSDMETTMEINS